MARLTSVAIQIRIRIREPDDLTIFQSGRLPPSWICKYWNL